MTTSCYGDDRSTRAVSFQDDDKKSVQVIRNGSGNQKTVAVTGANGFIGSHIVKQLLAKGYKVRGTVQHNEPALVDFLTVLPNAAKNLTLYEKDLFHGSFDEVFQGCDCVFHLASPTLKHQREMKEPHLEMIHTARHGTMNILRSSKKTNVSTVVITSSMCAAIPKTNAPSGGLPDVLNETHWADHDFLINKGSYYAASKVLAEKHAVGFTNDSAIRLIRICPSFTVGPMLGPTVNSSMERFARICAGEHHEQIPNRSISLVDVRDTAAHHIAAYEKGFDGRFFSLTEAWPWTLVYNALKILNPEMKCPKALSNEKHLPVRKYDNSRMKALGIKERSFWQVLREAVEENKRTKISHGPIQCHKISVLPEALTQFFVTHAGYYGSVEADGTFFMIETIANFEEKKEVSHSVYLSWFFPGNAKPTVMQVQKISRASVADGKLTVAVYDISLTFTPSADSYSVQGTLAGSAINARSFNLSVPFNHLGGTYSAIDGSSVNLTFGTNNTISFYNSSKSSDPSKIITYFTYNPTKREFTHNESNDKEKITSQLFLNAAAGNGLRATLVQFNPEKLPGTTKFFYLSPSFLPISDGGLPTGAKDLAAFAGYYPFPNVNGFVSIVGTTAGTSKETVRVGIYLYGGPEAPEPKEYTSFNFDNSTNTLTFPQNPDLTLKFEKEFKRFTRPITKVTTGQITAISYFTPAPLSALGSFTLHGFDPLDINTKYSLQITIGNDGESLVYKKNRINVFKPTSMFEYNAVEQNAVVGEHVFNLCVNPNKGISCGVTTVDKSGKPTGLQSVLSVFQKR